MRDGEAGWTLRLIALPSETNVVVEVVQRHYQPIQPRCQSSHLGTDLQ